MNIEEIRQTRVEAERVILEVLRVFKETTGMSVIGCDVGYVTLNEFGSALPKRVTTNVTLKIEPI